MNHTRITRGGISALLFILIALTACDSEPGLEERIIGTWKNGDGNLIRFEEGETAAVGQEGLSGEGPCRYEIRADTVAVTMLPEGETDAYVIYNMHLVGDTLRILTLERHESGAVRSITVEQFAEQVGRPMYKLDFLKEKPKEKK